MATILTGLTRSIKVLSRSNVVLDATMGMVAKATNNLVNQFATFSKIQDSASAQNAIYTNGLLANTGALFAATGGFKNAAMAQAELAKVGLPMAGKNILDLASRMKLSGEDTQKFMAVMENSLGPGNFTQQSLDNLAKDVVAGAISNRMSNEKVITAIGKLDSTLLMQAAFFGGGAAAAEFSRVLVTSVQPSMAGAAGDFAKMVLDGGVDFNTLQRLGIEEQVDALLKGQITSAEDMNNIVRIAAMNFDSIVGSSANLTRREFAALSGDTFGKIGLTAQRLNESLKQQEKVGKNTTDGLKETIAQFKESVLKVFEATVANLEPAFRFFMNGLHVAMGALSLIFTALSPVIKVLFYIAGILVPVIAALGALVVVIKIAMAMGAVVAGLFGLVLSPLMAVVLGLATIAAFFFGDEIIDSIKGVFDAEKRGEEQAQLREQTKSFQDVDNRFRDFYNMNMGPESPAATIGERSNSLLSEILIELRKNPAPPLVGYPSPYIPN